MNDISDAGKNDSAEFNARLWKLLSMQARAYTSGRACAVTYETAQSLLDSIVFTLSLNTPEGAAALTSADDADALFFDALRQTDKKLDIFEKLWNTACSEFPSFGSISMRGTLKSIGNFRKNYDPRYFAHVVPCDIDYQLCFPVPESLSGVDYANEYLLRLIIENRVMNRFDARSCERVLMRYCSDFSELIANLFEPVAADALGCVIAGKSPLSLSLSGSDEAVIFRSLSPLSREHVAPALERAAQSVSSALGCKEREYAMLRDFASSLAGRITALKSIKGVFLMSGGHAERA